MKYIKYKGPFTIYRLKDKRKNFLDVCLTKYDGQVCGRGWGTDNEFNNPSWCLRLGHFNVFSLERLRKGFVIFILGFWYMS